VSFIAVLLTTRLQEIADFAAIGAQGQFVFWFTLYQIPYILPLAIPISCLISAILLVSRLSTTYELTALRASGMTLKNMMTPILLAAACVSLFNFYVASELATSSHLKSRVLEQELRSINPLLLLENRQLIKYKGIYVNSLGPTRVGESASDLVIALANKKNNRISLMFAKNIRLESLNLIGDKVTLVNSLGVNERDLPDHLFIENMNNITTSSKDFLQMLKGNGEARIKTDYLKLSLLLLRSEEDLKGLNKTDPKDLELVSFYQKRIVRNFTEILRRIDLGVAPLTFTLMGIAFGITISRRSSHRGILWVLCLSTLFMFSYFAGKGMDHRLLPSALLFLGPHLLIVAASLRTLNKVSKGIE